MRRGTGWLVGVGFAWSLACGGAGPAPSEVVAPAPVLPSAATEPARDADGLAAELGFPRGSGELRVDEAARVHVLHTSAFDAGTQWDVYSAWLESEGWVRAETPVPPFQGLFTRDGRRVVLTCELAGSSVWVKAEVK